MNPRFLVPFCLILIPLPATPARSGLPSPDRSTYGLTGQDAPCQFRFRADGGLDTMTLTITVRHSFDYVMPGVPTTVTVNAAPGTPAFCGCCDLRREGTTDADGVFIAEFSRLGGRGTLTLDVTTHAGSTIPFWSIPVTFTSPDLNGSCDAAPGSATTLLDLALWAAGGGSSDYNCDGNVDLLDLAIWASGLGQSCEAAGCP